MQFIDINCIMSFNMRITAQNLHSYVICKDRYVTNVIYNLFEFILCVVCFIWFVWVDVFVNSNKQQQLQQQQQQQY